MKNDYLNAMALVSMIIVFFVFGISRADANEMEEFYVAPSTVSNEPDIEYKVEKDFDLFGFGFDLSPVAEIGYIAVEYNEDNASEIGNYVKVGIRVNDTKFYMWATEEQTEPKLFGQSMGNLKSLSWGGGVGQEFGKWTMFMEAGTSDFDFEQNDLVVHEMVRTVMYKNHGYEGRYHPGRNSNGKTPHPGHKNVYDWDSDQSYEIFDPIVAKLGVSFEPVKHVVFTAAYRISVADTEMNL